MSPSLLKDARSSYFKGGIKEPRVAIVRLSSLGDIIVSCSVLSAFCRVFAPRSVCIYVDRRFSDVLAIDASKLPNVSIRPLSLKQTSLRAKLALFRELKKEHYDIIIDMQGLIKSALITALLKAPLKIGYDYHSAKEGLSSLAYDTKASVPYSEQILRRNIIVAFKPLCFELGIAYNERYINELVLEGRDASFCGGLDRSIITRYEASETRKPPLGKSPATAVQSVFHSVPNPSQATQSILDSTKDSAPSVEKAFHSTKMPSQTVESKFHSTQPPVSSPATWPTSPLAKSLAKTQRHVLFALETSVAAKELGDGFYIGLANSIFHSIDARLYLLEYSSRRGDELYSALVASDASLASRLVVVRGEGLRVVASLLASMDLIIGPDTGISYLAWALKREVLVLYSATSLKRFALEETHSIDVNTTPLATIGQLAVDILNKPSKK